MTKFDLRNIARFSAREVVSYLLLPGLLLAGVAPGPVLANGRAGISAVTTDLSDPAASLLTIFNSNAEDCHVGSPPNESFVEATATGDFNGDGIADVFVGAPFSKGPDNKRNNAGKVSIYFGRGDGTLSGIRDAALEAPPAGAGPDVTIYGSDATGIGGLLLPGDYNGDGVDDLALGAPSATPAPNQALYGAVYVYFGTRGLASGTRYDLAGQAGPAPSAILGGISTISLSGGSLAKGDVNGDGITDLVVGAYLWTKGIAAFTGAAFLFLGKRDFGGFRSMSAPVTAANGPDGAFAGIDSNDFFGESLAVTDVNFDGFGDLVIAAPFADAQGNKKQDAGDVYILLGGTAFSGKVSRDLNTAAGAADILIYGGSNSDNIGASLMSWDFDGDGKPDLLVGAPKDKTATVQDLGFFHVFLSGPGFVKGTVRDLSTGPAPEGTGADAKILGPGRNLDFQRPGAVGDVNGDKLPDLILSSWLSPKSGAQNVGAVFVVLSKPSLTRGVVLDMASTQEGIGPDWVILGAAGQDRLGAAVAAADVTLNGKSAVIIAAAGGDGPNGSRSNSGNVYILKSPTP